MRTYRVSVPEDGYCHHTCDTTEGSPSGGAWLFRYPNLALNIYADGMNVERIIPVGANRTHVVYDYYSASTDEIDMESMISMSNVVLDEDQAMCEQVQRAIDSGAYKGGPLSPKHEIAVAWFQSRILDEVNRPSRRS
jgi:choline monooxygenase